MRDYPWLFPLLCLVFRGGVSARLDYCACAFMTLRGHARIREVLSNAKSGVYHAELGVTLSAAVAALPGPGPDCSGFRGSESPH